MKKNTTMIAALMTLMIAITLVLAGGSYAANQNNNTNSNTANNARPQLTTEQRATMQQNREKIQEAIKNNDYNTWKTLIENSTRGNQNTDQATFDKIVEQHKLRDQIQTAITNGDYNTWKTLVAKSTNDTEMLEAIDTEADFKQFVEAHKLIQAGRIQIEKGQSIMNELGLKRPAGKKFNKGFKMGMKQGIKQGFRVFSQNSSQ